MADINAFDHHERLRKQFYMDIYKAHIPTDKPYNGTQHLDSAKVRAAHALGHFDKAFVAPGDHPNLTNK